jgi:hypothetical protein
MDPDQHAEAAGRRAGLQVGDENVALRFDPHAVRVHTARALRKIAEVAQHAAPAGR